MSECEDTSIQVDGRRRVTFLDRGPRDGVTVMYLHGFPGSRLEQCLFPYEALERVGVRLISVDRPGWGLTDPLAGDRVARARDVLHVADHLGIDQFPLMAISAGGGYGVALAATAPTRIARLVLVSAQAAPYDDPATITRMQPGQLAVLAATRAGRTAGFVDGCAAFRREFLEDPIGRFWSNFATLSAAERAFIEQPEVRNTFIGDMTEGLRTSPRNRRRLGTARQPSACHRSDPGRAPMALRRDEPPGTPPAPRGRASAHLRRLADAAASSRPRLPG